MQFPWENHLNGCQIFGWFNFLKTVSEPNFVCFPQKFHARSVHWQHLQTRDYPFAADRVALSVFTSIQRALEKATA